MLEDIYKAISKISWMYDIDMICWSKNVLIDANKKLILRLMPRSKTKLDCADNKFSA